MQKVDKKLILLRIISVLIFLFLPISTQAEQHNFEIALMDGVMDFDNGPNEFIFGSRISWLISHYSLEFNFNYVPRKGNDLIFYNINGLIEISNFGKDNDYPQLIPFAIGGIGRTHCIGENGWDEISYNVGAGVKIYKSKNLGVRADFREHFYWHRNELKLNIEICGGILFKF